MRTLALFILLKINIVKPKIKSYFAVVVYGNQPKAKPYGPSTFLPKVEGFSDFRTQNFHFCFASTCSPYGPAPDLELEASIFLGGSSSIEFLFLHCVDNFKR